MDNKNTLEKLLDDNGQRITGRITQDDLKNYQSPVLNEGDIRRFVKIGAFIENIKVFTPVFLTYMAASIVLCAIFPAPLFLIGSILSIILLSSIAESQQYDGGSGDAAILSVILLAPGIISVGLVHLATWFLFPHDSYINMEVMAFMKFLAWLGL